MPINSVNQDQIFGFLYSEFFTLWYKDGAKWVNIPGIESVSQSGAEAPMREVVSMNGAATQNMGITRTGTLTFNAKLMPNDKAWRDLRDAQYTRKTLHFRIDTDATQLYASPASNGATCAISDTGVVTFAGASGGDDAPTITGTGYGRGSMIVGDWGGTERYFIINNITNASPPVTTAIEVMANDTYDDTPAELTAGRFALYAQVPMRQSFSAYVPSASNMELSAESEMMTTLTLGLRSRFSVPTIIRPEGT